jgi:hypothetical protein
MAALVQPTLHDHKEQARDPRTNAKEKREKGSGSSGVKKRKKEKKKKAGGQDLRTSFE